MKEGEGAAMASMEEIELDGFVAEELKFVTECSLRATTSRLPIPVTHRRSIEARFVLQVGSHCSFFCDATSHTNYQHWSFRIVRISQLLLLLKINELHLVNKLYNCEKVNI